MSLSRPKSVGVSYRRVSRSTGETALERSRYQRPALDSEKPGEHRRGFTLAPNGAPSFVHEPLVFWQEVGTAERRVDALEAWVYDITWPRELPESCLDDVVDRVFCEFIERGLVVQIDFECTLASDGGDNPHIHALISTRPLINGSFAAKKDRAINNFFRNAGGYLPRFNAANAFNAAAAKLGLSVRFDGHSNAFRDEPAPENRLPRKAAARLREPEMARKINARNRQRERRKSYNKIVDAIDVLEADQIAAMQTLREIIETQTRYEETKRGGVETEKNETTLDKAEPSAAAYKQFDIDRYVWSDPDAIRIDGSADFVASIAACTLAKERGWSGLKLGGSEQDKTSSSGFYDVELADVDRLWVNAAETISFAHRIADLLKSEEGREEIAELRHQCAMVQGPLTRVDALIADLTLVTEMSSIAPRSTEISCIAGLPQPGGPG